MADTKINRTPVRGYVATSQLAAEDAKENIMADTKIDRTPVAGAPATILLYTDTVAAVVTRVSKASIWVQRVETGPEWTDNQAEVDVGGYPVRVARGILDKPIGEEERYARNDDTNLHGKKGRGAVKVRVGLSISRTDYRH